jgi:hypothetical protein
MYPNGPVGAGEATDPEYPNTPMKPMTPVGPGCPRKRPTGDTAALLFTNWMENVYVAGPAFGPVLNGVILSRTSWVMSKLWSISSCE